ncbi:ISAon1 family transposase N-terminal region protein, partial [Elizabethkingia meningoseptica]
IVKPHVKRRRWTDKSSGEFLQRDWQLVSKGTRMTKDFAGFLKKISRYQSSSPQGHRRVLWS